MKSRGLLYHAMTLALMAEGFDSTNPTYKKEKKEKVSIFINTHIHTVVPKGCKKYYFDKHGFYKDIEKDLIIDSVFSCIASSEKAAKKKFAKWQKAAIV